MEIVEIYYSNNRDNLVSIYEFIKNSSFTYDDILYIKKELINIVEDKKISDAMKPRLINIIGKIQDKDVSGYIENKLCETVEILIEKNGILGECLVALAKADSTIMLNGRYSCNDYEQNFKNAINYIKKKGQKLKYQI
jgi:hypothetical protein